MDNIIFSEYMFLNGYMLFFVVFSFMFKILYVFYNYSILLCIWFFLVNEGVYLEENKIKYVLYDFFR